MSVLKPKIKVVERDT